MQRGVVGIVACLSAAFASRLFAADTWPPERPLPEITVTERTEAPLVTADRPWESLCINYFRLLREGREWRMWYSAYDKDHPADGDASLCYATSADGIHWEKPNLGLVEFNGSRENNILVTRVGGAGVFVDPTAKPADRYKITYVKLVGEAWQVFGGTSPDGLHWTWIEAPVLAANSDTDNVCIADGDVYRMYVRMWSGGMYAGKRQVGYTESRTFNFAPPRVILEPDAKDPADLHFYNSAATKIMDGLYAMFPSAFYTGTQTIRPHLALGRDGRTFERVGREQFLPLGSTFDSQSIYVAAGAIPTEQPDEFWIYYLGDSVKHDDYIANKASYACGVGRLRIKLVPQ